MTRRQLLAATIALAGSAVAGCTPSPGSATVPAAAPTPATGTAPASATASSAAGAALSAPSANSSALATAAGASGTVVNVNFSEARSLNPLLAQDGASQIIWELMFEPLVTPDAQTGVPSPVLAERWELAPDGRSYTFHLRRNVTWSDGQPFTAEDVKFTYDSAANPQLPTATGSSRFDNVAAFEAPDPLTFRITLKEPFCPLLINGLTLPILPRHRLASGSAIGDDAFNTQTPVGTGPYVFGEWARDDHVTMLANPTYWRGKPKIDRWQRRVVKDINVVVAQLKTGEADYAYVDPGSLDELKQPSSPVTIYPFFALGFDYIGWNQANPLFKDSRVRQALTSALDRQQIVSAILFGEGQVIDSPIPPFHWAYNASLTAPSFDLARARQLLAEAGWTAGPDGTLQQAGKPFSFTLLTNSGNPVRSAVATIAQDTYAKLGMQVQISQLESNAFLNTLRVKRDFDAVVYGANLLVDPDQTSFWASTSIGNGENYVGYSNPKVDQLLQQARVVPSCSQQDRKPLYDQFQQELATDQPYTFLHIRKNFVGANKRLQNFGPTTWGRPAWNIADWTLTR